MLPIKTVTLALVVAALAARDDLVCSPAVVGVDIGNHVQVGTARVTGQEFIHRGEGLPCSVVADGGLHADERVQLGSQVVVGSGGVDARIIVASGTQLVASNADRILQTLLDSENLIHSGAR